MSLCYFLYFCFLDKILWFLWCMTWFTSKLNFKICIFTASLALQGLFLLVYIPLCDRLTAVKTWGFLLMRFQSIASQRWYQYVIQTIMHLTSGNYLVIGFAFLVVFVVVAVLIVVFALITWWKLSWRWYPYTWATVTQSGAVLTRSNMTWCCVHHCSYRGRI